LAVSSSRKLAEILDNAVMDHRDPVVGVRVGIVFVGAAMRRPAGVAEADVAGQRRSFSLSCKLRSLPLARSRVSRPFSSVATPAES